MNIYIVRHGTTVWNEKKITQGYFKNRLSERGKKEINRVSEKLRDVKIDIIYSSPLVRAIQSANIINKYHNVKVVKEGRLIGINQGIFAGKYWKDYTEEEKVLHDKRDPITGMESYKSAFIRCKDFVDNEIRNSKYENIVIVTHNTNATCVEYALKNITPNFDDHNIMNIYDNGKLSIIKSE